MDQLSCNDVYERLLAEGIPAEVAETLRSK